MDEKPEWLKRAEDEQKDLAGKIQRLSNMLSDAKRMQHVTTADQALMHDQLIGMIVYNSKLIIRIQLHGGTTCAE